MEQKQPSIASFLTSNNTFFLTLIFLVVIVFVGKVIIELKASQKNTDPILQNIPAADKPLLPAPNNNGDLFFNNGQSVPLPNVKLP